MHWCWSYCLSVFETYLTFKMATMKAKVSCMTAQSISHKADRRTNWLTDRLTEKTDRQMDLKQCGPNRLREGHKKFGAKLYFLYAGATRKTTILTARASKYISAFCFGQQRSRIVTYFVWKLVLSVWSSHTHTLCHWRGTWLLDCWR